MINRAAAFIFADAAKKDTRRARGSGIGRDVDVRNLSREIANVQDLLVLNLLTRKSGNRDRYILKVFFDALRRHVDRPQSARAVIAFFLSENWRRECR